jgi:hypothetical protein
MLGAGSQASQTLGSLGTTTTVLHGNNAGVPSFAAVSLTADVSGILPVPNGGIGSISGSQTQYLQIQPNTTSTTYRWNNPPLTNSSDYAFPSQTPGGTLAAGSRTITLTPCPLGVNGTDAAHYLYISGGTGTAEASLLTGGTCTSGLSTGTVILTIANSHSGPWTIQSASQGIQEAAISSGVGGWVYIGPGVWTIQATVTFLAGQRVTGASPGDTLVEQNFTVGNCFFLPLAANIEDMSFFMAGSLTATSGYYIVAFGGGATIRHIRGGAGGSSFILLDTVTTGTVDDVSISGISAAGITVGVATAGHASGPTISNYQISASGTNAIGILGVNGQMELTNFDIQVSGSSSFGILLAANTPFGFSASQISNGIIDSASCSICQQGTGTFASLIFSHLYVDSGAGNQAVVFSGGLLTGLLFDNIEFYGFGGAATISVTSAQDVTITGCTMADALASGTDWVVLNSVVGVTTANNKIGIISTTGGFDTTNTNEAIGIFGTSDKLTITGNSLGGTLPLFLNGSVSGTAVIASNRGVSDVAPTIAEAATITLLNAQQNDRFFVTGTGTNITTITGTAADQLFDGRKITIIPTNAGGIALATGGNFAAAHAVPQFLPLTLTYDLASTKWY